MIEVAAATDGDEILGIFIRDSKDNAWGESLYFTPAEWQTFLAGAKAGEFDHVVPAAETYKPPRVYRSGGDDQGVEVVCTGCGGAFTADDQGGGFFMNSTGGIEIRHSGCAMSEVSHGSG